jgi:hypothetical protein
LQSSNILKKGLEHRGCDVFHRFILFTLFQDGSQIGLVCFGVIFWLRFNRIFLGASSACSSSGLLKQFSVPGALRGFLESARFPHEFWSAVYSVCPFVPSAFLILEMICVGGRFTVYWFTNQPSVIEEKGEGFENGKTVFG